MSCATIGLLLAFTVLSSPPQASLPASSADLSDLPLVDIAPRAAPVRDRASLPEAAKRGSGITQSMLVVILSGDGGWREIDSELGDYFAKQGYPVVGIDSLKYYWKARTPEVAAADLVRVLRDRMSRYRSEKVMLVGYSFGADVASFLANRVPDDLRAKLWRVGLIGPSTDGDFEIHGAGLIGARDDNRLDNVAEVIAAQAKGIPLLCVEGKEDTEAICDVVAKQGVPMRSMPGGHHLLGRYQALGEVLLSELPALPAAAR